MTHASPIRRLAVVAVLAAALAACSSDAKVSTPGATSGGTTTPGATSPGTTSPGTTTPKGSLDCAAVKDALASASVNIQVLVQLPRTTDVSAWPTDIGTMSKFGGQLDTLEALSPYGADVAKTVAFFKGANDIAQRGYQGDTSAPAALEKYLGTSLTAVLSKQVAFGMALDGAHC
jgi:hypothetical protein